MKNDFKMLCDTWQNTHASNQFLYELCERKVNDTPYLKAHYDVVSSRNLGFGEKAFRYFWAMILSQLEQGSSFLEIGVYKGSIIALSQLIAREIGLDLHTYGVTPLNNSGDKYSEYDDNCDYSKCIGGLYTAFGLSFDHTTIIKGMSTDPDVKHRVLEEGPYDVIYIDGGHDYNTVASDLELAKAVILPDGFLVVDDAATALNSYAKYGFSGHGDVARAVDDVLGGDTGFKHLMACGHMRLWGKL
jgi:hypothetical protein